MSSFILSIVTAGLLSLWGSSCKSGPETHGGINAAVYPAKLDSIHSIRDSLGKSYRAAGSETEKAEVLKHAKTIFLSALKDDIFSSWYGTSYDFYGTSETPQSGVIACGYFVTTALRDMGVRLDRRALAECASETMIRKLIDKDHISVYKGKTIEDFVSSMLDRGDGLYILGLDYHTGFLLCEDGKAHFIHAFPPGVKKERPGDAPYLAGSKYRVAGSISADMGFYRRWVLQESM